MGGRPSTNLEVKLPARACTQEIADAQRTKKPGDSSRSRRGLPYFIRDRETFRYEDTRPAPQNKTLSTNDGGHSDFQHGIQITLLIACPGNRNEAREELLGQGAPGSFASGEAVHRRKSYVMVAPTEKRT